MAVPTLHPPKKYLLCPVTVSYSGQVLGDREDIPNRQLTHEGFVPFSITCKLHERQVPNHSCLLQEVTARAGIVHFIYSMDWAGREGPEQHHPVLPRSPQTVPQKTFHHTEQIHFHTINNLSDRRHLLHGSPTSLTAPQWRGRGQRSRRERACYHATSTVLASRGISLLSFLMSHWATFGIMLPGSLCPQNIYMYVFIVIIARA